MIMVASVSVAGVVGMLLIAAVVALCIRKRWVWKISFLNGLALTSRIHNEHGIKHLPQSISCTIIFLGSTWWASAYPHIDTFLTIIDMTIDSSEIMIELHVLYSSHNHRNKVKNSHAKSRIHRNEYDDQSERVYNRKMRPNSLSSASTFEKGKSRRNVEVDYLSFDNGTYHMHWNGR